MHGCDFLQHALFLTCSQVHIPQIDNQAPQPLKMCERLETVPAINGSLAKLVKDGFRPTLHRRDGVCLLWQKSLRKALLTHFRIRPKDPGVGDEGQHGGFDVNLARDESEVQKRLLLATGQICRGVSGTDLKVPPTVVELNFVAAEDKGED